MFGGGVVDHEVQNDAHAALVAAGDEGVEVVESAEFARDGAIVPDIVAGVGARGVEDRREPEAVDAEVRKVIEAGGDAGDIADAVAVRIREGAGIDLVEDGRMPPRRGGVGGHVRGTGVQSRRRCSRMVAEEL